MIGERGGGNGMMIWRVDWIGRFLIHAITNEIIESSDHGHSIFIIKSYEEKCLLIMITTLKLNPITLSTCKITIFYS